MQALGPGTFALNACLTGDDACDRAPNCVVHVELARVQTLLEQQLAGITLSQLVEREYARRVKSEG